LTNETLAPAPRLRTVGGQLAQFKEPRHPIESLVRSDLQALFRDDDQLGGVPVALTLQQLSTSLHDRLIMYSTAVNFGSAGAD
jgi:hypothetical protein